MVVEMKKLKYYRTHILVVLSFIFGCILTTNLTPIEKTCRIENTDEEYNIMKNSKLKNPELIILILSQPDNLDKRNTIRHTWLKLKSYEESYENNNEKFKFKHYFVIGSLNLNVDAILHLTSEQSEFNDILILPMYDSYQNLTNKLLMSFEWLHEQYNYGLGFKYVLKCDDDSFIRIDKLSNELRNLEKKYLDNNLIKNLGDSSYYRTNIQPSKNISKNLELYWGYFHGNAKIKIGGKWKESSWIACDTYLPYALGGGYILSKGLVSYLAQNSEYLRQYTSEDVSVGLWLSSIGGIIRVHDIRFDTEWNSRGCQNFHLIMHNISMKDMKKFYNNLIETNNLCTTQILKRNYYFYDWSQPPSQCCKTVLNKLPS